MTDAEGTRRAAIDVRDVLDTLWLAAWMTRAAAPAETTARADAQAQPTRTVADATTPASPGVVAPAAVEPAATMAATATAATSPAAGDLYAPGAGGTSDSAVRARPIRIPAGSALPNGLPIVRALRPIPMRLPSRVDLELDEAATVEASTQGFGIIPVMRPRLERWFEAALVVEHSPSSEIWSQTVIEIERMLEFSGTFRDVRTLRLRRTPTVHLVNEAGAVVPPERLRDPASRRIIFVFTPAVSEAWTDGTFGRLIELWGTSTPVALLHALPRRLWANTTLGEPAALVANQAPGSPNRNLRRQRAWWARARRLDGRRAVLPVLGLEPDSARRWAEMLAARRGRTAPAFLVPIDPLPGTRRERPRRVPATEERLEALRANAPDAFRLAVRLAVGPFTMPIVQLVQASIFGRDAQHSQIAEVMLSGLVSRLTPADANVAPEQVQFQVMAEAAPLLLQSLRRDDARRMSALLQGYIEQHFGTPRDQLVLLNDPRGPLLVPAAAQPFARLNEQFVEWLEQSTPRAPATLAPAASVADDAPYITPTEPPAEEGEDLRVTTLFRTFGELRRTTVPWLKGVRILWVDDRPHNNLQVVGAFERLGAHIEIVLSTDAAIAAVDASGCDMVITDMGRPEGPEAGLDLLLEMRRRHQTVPVIVFAARWAVINRTRARDAGAFGCTNMVPELIALVFDAAADARGKGYLERCVALLPPAAETAAPELAASLPAAAAGRLALLDVAPEERNGTILAVVAAITQCGYVQLFRMGDTELPLVADRIDEGLVRYPAASLTGIIGRAARTGQTVWVPDVVLDVDYIVAERSTRSELAISVPDAAGRIAFVVNIESRERHAFSRTQVRWLDAFVRECDFTGEHTAAAAVEETGVAAPEDGQEPEDQPRAYEYWCFVGHVAEDDDSVGQFVRRLERELERRIGPDARVFWPRRDAHEDGEDLGPAMRHAVASSRILVPILTPRYVHHPWSGHEWQAFAIRGGQNAGRIVPVIWAPLPPELPAAVARMQLTTEHFPADYPVIGLRALGRSRAGARDFANVVERLADRIAQLGRMAGPTPPPSIPLEALPNAFAPAADATIGEAVVERSEVHGEQVGTDWAIVVAMSDYDHLPAVPAAGRQAQAFTAWLTEQSGGALAPAHVRTMASVAGDALEAIAADMLDAADSRRSSLGRRLYIYASGHAAHDTKGQPSLLTRDASPENLGFSIPLVEYADWFSQAGLFDEVVLVADLVTGAIPTRLASRVVPFSIPSARLPPAATFYALSLGPSIGPLTEATIAGLRGAAAAGSEHVTSDDLSRYLVERAAGSLSPVLHRRGMLTLARVPDVIPVRFVFDDRLVGEDAQIVDAEGQILARAVAGVPWTLRMRLGTYAMEVAGETTSFVVDGSTTVQIRSTAPTRRVLVAGTGHNLPQAVQWISEAIGTMLGRAGHHLITGGWPGVDHMVARAFAKALPAGVSAVERLVQVVPRSRRPDFPDGTVVDVDPGEAFAEEARRADVVILIGGAGGTFRVFEHAQAHGLPVYPLPASGGDALEAYQILWPTDESRLRTLDIEVHSSADAIELAKRVRALLAAPPTEREQPSSMHAEP